MLYDGITSWVNVGDVVSGINCSGPNIGFATDGTPYVSYTEENKLVVKKLNGSNWVFVGANPITSGSVDYPLVAINSNGTPYTAFTDNSLSGKATMMRFTNAANDALPVELTSFTATAKSSSVELNWQTATEVNSYGFEIQRIRNEELGIRNWEKIGFVQGSGNSNSPKEYSFVDSNPATEKSFYRLKMIDIDGSFEYSDIVEVSFNLTLSTFELFQNYPNPFNPETVITYQLPVSSFVTLRVFDVLGKEVVTLVNEVKDAGQHKIKFDASKISSGVYFYSLQTGSFYSTKKLMVLK